MASIPATWMRGGTSKCWVFERADLQVAGKSLDEVLLRLFGSPDERQVDGIGGGTSTTSKAVILAVSANPDVDVDYTFAQVGIAENTVDWGSNCGNCSAVVGPYAIERGWVSAQNGTTAVRTLNTNTNQLILQRVPTPNGAIERTGSQMIPGVPFPSMPVGLGFLNPAGKTTGRLFPTGHPVDELTFDGSPVRVTLIDAGAPVVIIDAATIGLDGLNNPAAIDSDSVLLAGLERLRREAAVRMGLAATTDAAARAIPKVALVARTQAGDDADFAVSMLSMGRLHPALAITGSVALTMAAHEAGTIVRELSRELVGARAGGGSTGRASQSRPDAQLTMRTPAGLVETFYEDVDGIPVVGAVRSARRLANAELLLPEVW
ncbi:methylitaconate delta2-delta3-isomerase [Cryobacterium frigoriphilum]|uniref:Methylitaconate delta2-delta3-isomerase n=1 Tax=Cryobacterium frigoriphilum TaxID=1259150 RepID=A0A4R9A811_9MICO|nr:PrpF domain-containing protein [Cryobacterium frigoriphilum]TFD54019.1 methylitaconate delta2-delta3-isomerase [Cryobacterium frigoriphilum]